MSSELGFLFYHTNNIQMLSSLIAELLLFLSALAAWALWEGKSVQGKTLRHQWLKEHGILHLLSEYLLPKK